MFFEGEVKNYLWRSHKPLAETFTFLFNHCKQMYFFKASQKLLFGNNNFGIPLEMSNTNLLKFCLSEVRFSLPGQKNKEHHGNREGVVWGLSFSLWQGRKKKDRKFN